MNELFRFSLARAAQVTDSLSLSLERRTVFQAQLQKIITANPRAKWERLEAPSLDYLGGKLPWIQSLQASRSANSGDLIGQANNFPSQVRTTLNAAPAAQSVPGVAKLASVFQGSAKPLSDLFDDLCDLMIALIVCRASGPNRCDQLVRLLDDRPIVETSIVSTLTRREHRVRLMRCVARSHT